MSLEFDYKRHCFGVKDTIGGVFCYYNSYTVAKQRMAELSAEFNRINNFAVPKPGSVLLIPVVLVQ